MLDIYRNIENKLLYLTAETSVELCRYYRERLSNDSSPTVNFNIYQDIPANHESSSLYSRSNIVKAFDILTRINLYRKLGMQHPQGYNVLISEEKLNSLFCSLKVVAEYQYGTKIPDNVCRKQLVFLGEPHNSATFDTWMYSILKQNTKQFCHVQNALSSIPDSSFRRIRCPKTQNFEARCRF
ncbi:Hypothetical predicted protein [Mytilus galloprovincialis]|uniref:Uncharacterized protein n=1 Tax=Mytilus galloprovincialis TaxID=29158 RepID=A0A8B6GH06_MYTGA|nr:Hypothetical predicted protein [Mytilus galloprovincialis]